MTGVRPSAEAVALAVTAHEVAGIIAVINGLRARIPSGPAGP